MNHIKLILLVVAMLISDIAQAYSNKRSSTMGINQIYVGGRLGVAVPLALGRATDEISFKDVAAYGFTAIVDGMWMQSQSIGLGAELGFSNYPYRSQYWSGLNYRGSFDANYKDINAGLTGRVIIGTYDVKPFLGVRFGGHYLRNSLNFLSRFEGSSNDESVDYISNKFHLGYGFSAGIFYKIGDNASLSISAQLNIIPFLKEEMISSVDPYTFVTKEIVMNPHGNQNNISFTIGLHFGANHPAIKRLK